MAHERDTLAASRVKWIGVMASELSESVLPRFTAASRCSCMGLRARLCIDKDALLPITKHDQKKVRRAVAYCANSIYQGT